jgi:hypothetical protein
MMPALTLFIAAVFYRIFAGYCGAENSWLLNFSPVAAIALCGPVIFPRRVARPAAGHLAGFRHG